MITFQSPAKLIISGEYSGLFGHEVISFAINRYTECNIIRKNSTFFKNNQKSKKFLLYAVDLLEKKFNIGINDNFSIFFKSQIEQNSGFGSSAAFINSFLFALCYLNKKTFTNQQLFEIGKELENFFHSKSSGADILTSLIGGVTSLKESKKIARSINDNFYVINSGKINHSTAEAVNFVLNKYKNEKNIFNDLFDIVNNIKIHIQNKKNFRHLIKENHNILFKIGVVQECAMNFIRELEENGCVGKISGSGSIYGPGNGNILVFGDDFNLIKKICDKFNYKIYENIQIDQKGTRKKIISYSAPGKVIISGEHALMYGKKGISMAINNRIKIDCSYNLAENFIIKNDNKKQSISKKEIATCDIKKIISERDILKYILSQEEFKFGIDLKILSNIKSGMGSSGAFIVVILTCLYELKFQKKISNKKLFQKSIEIAKIFDENSSFIDIATSIHGGLIYYKKYKVINSINKFYNIYALSVEEKKNTTEVISLINKTISKQERFIIYEKINACVNKIWKSIRNNNFENCVKNLKINQHLLSLLGLEDQKTKDAIKLLIKNGSKVAKISGSGLGDFVIGISKKKLLINNKNIIKLKLETSGIKNENKTRYC